MTAVQAERVIDLGDMRLEPAEPAQPAGPRAAAGRAFLVAVVAAALLGGSVVPIAPLALVAVRDDGVRSSYAVAGDRLYLTRPSADTTSSVWRLTAVSVPDGRELWTAPYDVPGGRILQLGAAGDVLLVTGGDNGGRERRTHAYRARDGVLMWTVDDDVTVAGDGRSAIVARPEKPLLSGLDLTTGRTLWMVEPDRAVAVLPLGRADGRFVVLGRDGRVEVREPRTGAVVRAARPLGPEEAPIASVLVGGSVALWFVGRDGTGVAALDPSTLELRWRRPHLVEGGGFDACAGLVCVSAPDGVDALDPRDGSTVWHTAPARYVVDLAGQLVVIDAAGGGIGAVRTIDPRTGAAVADLTGWRTGTSRGEPVLTATGRRAGGTVLALLGPGPGQLRPVAGVPEVMLFCQRGTDAVACRTTAGELRIYRLGGRR